MNPSVRSAPSAPRVERARRRGVTLRSESLLLPMIDDDDALRRSATLHFASGVPLTNVFERRTFALHDQAP
jgi:hypothetical protein